MNKMKNFKRRFSLSVPRTETIEESLTEFTEQFNQLNNQRNEGKEPPAPAAGRVESRCPFVCAPLPIRAAGLATPCY